MNFSSNPLVFTSMGVIVDAGGVDEVDTGGVDGDD